MEAQLFVRIRGRVQGPYELEQLRALVRRGQLSRMHEVSTDGSVWKQAASFPDLFASPTVEAAQTVYDSRSSSGLSAADIPDLESPRANVTASWHYSQDDEPKGPVTFDDLKSLIAAGRLDSSALVWTDGMKEWEPAHTVAGLLPFSTGISIDGAGAAAKLDKEVLRTLFESRPWVKFIAFVLYCVGVIGVALGAAAIVMGARWNEAGIIASGGFSILYGGVSIWGGQLLYRYCIDVARLLREPSMRRLDVALRSLRRFWIFLSMILIVLLVNAIGIAIWAFSIGISLSGSTILSSGQPPANQQELQTAFQSALNANKQKVFESFHPVGSAKNIVVHDVSPQSKPGGRSSGLDVRFTIYWNGPVTADGFTKVLSTFDTESNHWTDTTILATNGVTNEELGEFVLNVGMTALANQLARQQQQ